MYLRTVRQSLLRSRHNLKILFDRNIFNVIKENYFVKYSHLIQDITLDGSYKNFLEVKKKIARNELIKYIQMRMKLTPVQLKNESAVLLRVWTHQCECVFAQRIRRGQQMFSLYTRLWEEQALKTFLSNLRLQVSKRSKECLFSAIGVTAYNWEKSRITEAEIRSHISEIDYIQILKKKTLDCKICNSVPDKIDKNLMAFCDCENRDKIDTFEDWQLFIEQPELIVWRKKHPSGSFEYKVYGSYKDVSAEDFLSVQIDTEYRKEWDTTAVALDVIERDPTPHSNSDCIYWELQWPKLFANRDYVFNRRFLVDAKQKVVVLLSKNTIHPAFPVKPNKYRVSDYYSSMVIKPYTEVNKPGIEFSLTYFDNPGVNIPSSVTAWVAYRALPDFLTRLRAATLKYRAYCKTHKCRNIYTFNDPIFFEKKTPQETGDTTVHKPKVKQDKKPDKKSGKKGKKYEDDDIPSCDSLAEEDDENIFDVLKNKVNERKSSQDVTFAKNYQVVPIDEVIPSVEKELDKKNENNDNSTKMEETITLQPASSAPGAEIILSPSPIVQAEQSNWKYLHPTYYLS